MRFRLLPPRLSLACLLALLLLPLPAPLPSVQAHGAEGVGLPRPECDVTPEQASVHEYGAPSMGFLLVGERNGMLPVGPGDAPGLVGAALPGDGSVPPCPYGDESWDGHHEFAFGGAVLLAQEPGASLCYGTYPDHVPGTPISVHDAVLSQLGSDVAFSIHTDFLNNVPPLDPNETDCGDFESDFGFDCVNSCAPGFPPGLDGSYQVYVTGFTGHVVTSPGGLGGCGPDCPPFDPCAHVPCGVPNPCAYVPCGVPNPCGFVSCAPPDPCRTANACHVPCCDPPAPTVLPPPGARACVGSERDFRIRLDTGRGAASRGAPAGTPDPVWTVMAPPSPSPVIEAFSRGVDPRPGQWVSDPASAWINPYPASDFGPAGHYEFSVPFLIPAGASQVVVSGRLAAADQVVLVDEWVPESAMRVVRSVPAPAAGAWTAFSYALDSFGNEEGLHVLRASVYNEPGEGPLDPVGLNLQAVVTGLCPGASAAALGARLCGWKDDGFTLDVGTAVGWNGQPLLAPGTMDPRWVAESYRDPTNNAQAANGATFFHHPPSGAGWVTSPRSGWINPYTEIKGPSGTTAYALTYEVPSNAFDVAIGGSFAASYQAVSIVDWVNGGGTPLAASAAPGGGQWTSFHQAITTPGLHTLRVVVQNQVIEDATGPHGTPITRVGPTALNLDARVTGKCGEAYFNVGGGGDGD